MQCNIQSNFLLNLVVLITGQQLALAAKLNITAFTWCSDKKEFFAAWNTRCKVKTKEACQLVYDYNKNADLVLKLQQDMAEDILNRLKRRATEAGIQAPQDRNVRRNINPADNAAVQPLPATAMVPPTPAQNAPVYNVVAQPAPAVVSSCTCSCSQLHYRAKTYTIQSN